jgi:hypothetical protein
LRPHGPRGRIPKKAAGNAALQNGAARRLLFLECGAIRRFLFFGVRRDPPLSFFGLVLECGAARRFLFQGEG